MKIPLLQKQGKPPRSARIHAAWFVPAGLALVALALLAARGFFLPSRPNILMITVDALRADHLDVYGYHRSTAPELTKLAERGARFDAVTVQAPLTVPSLFIIMTGKLFYYFSIPREMKTLAERLKSKGYTTAAFIRNPLLELDPQGIQRGFDTFFAPETLAEGGFTWEELPALAERQLYEQDLRAEALLEKADEWLQQNARNQPFFLWIHLFDTHDPYYPPPPYDSLYDADYKGDADGDIFATLKTDNPICWKVEKNPPLDDHRHIVALYDGEVRYTSAQVGAFLERFGKIGLDDRTLIIFSSDHGESLGEHLRWGHGISLYESELRIPLIMVLPGKIPPGIVVTQPVESLDIVPTILSLIGDKADNDSPGKDLTPLFKGGPVESKGTFALWNGEESYRENRWKMIRDHEGKFELYDLQADPREEKNLASQYPQILRNMDYMRQQKASRKIKIDTKTGQTVEEKLRSLGYLQ